VNARISAANAAAAAETMAANTDADAMGIQRRDG
jgi:hypothetical protein